MLVYDRHRVGDEDAVEELLDLAFGPDRLLKPAQALREGQKPADGLAFLVRDDAAPWGSRIIGNLTLWHVRAGPATPVLLLGPLAVHPDYQGKGIGRALMLLAINQARRRGHKAIILVGDPAYYSSFGFARETVCHLIMPGYADDGRFLGLELTSGALQQATGFVRPAPQESELEKLAT